MPEISHSLFGVYQRPQNKIEDNFPLGVTTAALASSDTTTVIPTEPTHVVTKPERVRQRAAADALGERTLEPGAQVRVIEFVGDWAVVARDGQKMGFVPAGSLAALH